MGSSAHGRLQVEGFFDSDTSTISYIVLDTVTRQCALIDSVLDYDPRSGRTSLTGVDRIVARVAELGATVQWVLETHVHADHLSAAPYLKRRLGGRSGIGNRITVVQKAFGELFNAGGEFARDGSQFDHLFIDGEAFTIGGLRARAIHTPGHTPACMTYVVDDDVPGQPAAAFVGDTLFMPDYGTARADFPGGDARTLYRSIRRLLSLPDQTSLHLCHDYKAPGRDTYAWVTTVGEEREHNVHIRTGVSEDQFVAMREARDATLGMPRLILPSIQINMRGGRLPEPEDNGTSYLKLPVDRL